MVSWVAVLFAAPTDARADDATAPRWRTAVGVATDFPVDVGARLDVETPFRLRLNTTLGFLPKAYVGAMNGVLEGFGAYDASTGDLIESTIQSSLVWRTHVGYRPFPKLGFYFDVGYGLVALGGNASTAALLEGVTGKTLPPQDANGTETFSAKATLHMLDVEVGWTFALAEHWQLRTALGGAFTLGSSTTITPQFTPRAPALVASFAQAADDYLDTTFRDYVLTPVVSVGVAYTF